LEILSQLGRLRQADIAIFGDDGRGAVPPAGLRSYYFGHVESDQRLALLYSSADVMVVPSLQEAFGKTLIEAMGCGTPVVAFDACGPADIVGHREDGYLARPFCSRDLADGISWCLAETGRTSALGRRARAKVEARYDIAVIARRYRSLYEQVLERAA